MRPRLVSMITLWALIAAAFGLGGLPGGQLLLWIFALGSCHEAARLLQRLSIGVRPWACTLGLGLALGGHLLGPAWSSVGTSLGLITVLLAHWSAPVGALPAALGTVITLAVGLGSLQAIATLAHPLSLWWTVWVIATIKLSDAGAYLIGTHLGRRALLPRISPGKTVAGFYGALLSGLIMGIVGAPLFLHPFLGPVLGVALAFLGSLGDLLESLLKRRAGVKDSGKVFPGIGGFLDLTDSLILAVPAGYLAIRLWGA